MTHTDVLKQVYNDALNLASEEDYVLEGLSIKAKTNVDYIVSRSETNKAVLSVIITLLVCKIVDPNQDIRYHYARMDNGFSARRIDTTHITPFMKSVKFPAMAESGWKTNTLAIDLPYDLNYPGVIKPTEIKNAFLNLIDQFQIQDKNPRDILLYLFILLVNQRDAFRIELAKPQSLSISAIMSLLDKHFTANYEKISGASRLPTLAIYAAYKCMMEQVERYNGKVLCSLENHNSADLRSGRIGDIDINNSDGTAFEGVEVKFDIIITPIHVSDAYEKFKSKKTNRYYLLTTANMANADWDNINLVIERIAQIHGCQVIVNGVYPTLYYYLRLLSNTATFIDYYVEWVQLPTFFSSISLFKYFKFPKILLSINFISSVYIFIS